jgi:hypothetical protein
MTSLLLLTSMILLGTLTFPVAAQDVLRPEIYGWGIDGALSDGAAFTVWANVTDEDSGINNVTANVRQDDGSPVVTLLSHNSTFFTAILSGVELNHTYAIWVESYDIAGNVAVSYTRNFDLRIVSNPELDPIVTLPYVVSISLLALGIAIGLSYIYNQRNPRLDPSEDEIESLDVPPENP